VVNRFWAILVTAFASQVVVPAMAADVQIVFGESLAPFADEKTGRGVEIDIVREALKAVGHSLRPRYVPQARVPLTLARGQVDGAATLTPESGVSAAYSDAYIRYRDIVVTHQARLTAPQDVAQLAGLRVVGFQNAAKYLGPAFAAMAKSNPRYSEEPSQLSQVRMLFAGQVDAIVIEHRIFAYQQAQLLASKFKERPVPVSISEPFEDIPYQVAFRTETLRDEFNLGLQRIRKSGVLADIEARYAMPGVHP
jgi:polar amino acid transport system substrate-binding protein